MTRRAVVIGHADADGHLIAEQTRRNLSLIAGFGVDVVVDPERTKDHKAWFGLDRFREIDTADFVFFVDLMFAPESFSDEAAALVEFAQRRPEKTFFLIDHHPLPLRRLSWARNLRAHYRPDVFECVFGPRSGMMVVAALCEHQEREVADIARPVHETLKTGVRRAAALGGSLPGRKLLALLRADCWNAILELGQDDPTFHRLPRGRRPSDQPESPVLRRVDELATRLLASGGADEGRVTKPSQRGRDQMPYDADIAEERFFHDVETNVRRRNDQPPSKDLEAIVTLLEVAALSLTSEPDAVFTLEELLAAARDVAGPDMEIDERDVKIVLQKARFIEKIAGGYRLK